MKDEKKKLKHSKSERFKLSHGSKRKQSKGSKHSKESKQKTKLSKTYTTKHSRTNPSKTKQSKQSKTQQSKQSKTQQSKQSKRPQSKQSKTQPSKHSKTKQLKSRQSQTQHKKIRESSNRSRVSDVKSRGVNSKHERKFGKLSNKHLVKSEDKTMEYKKIEYKKPPAKSSFKKASRGLKVGWSPDVRQIERTPSQPNPHMKGSKCYVKLDRDKTVKYTGIAHAIYKTKRRNSGMLTLTLTEDDTDQITFDIDTKKKSISHVRLQDSSWDEHAAGAHRIKFLANFGDIEWKHVQNKNMSRTSQSRGFDISWLEQLQDFRACRHC